MKKILGRVLLLGIFSLVAIGATRSYFSDQETSSGNTLEAGEIDLKIDNESFYNGKPNELTSWQLSDLTNQLFFNFRDLKPDDYGEDTISLHSDNDWWGCMEIKATKDDDNTCTEPEKPDDANCDIPSPEPNANLFDGELGGVLNFVWWADDGDNVLESGERIIDEGAALRYFDGKFMTLADSSLNIWGTPGPLAASKTHYIGKAWCFGILGKAPLTPGGYPDGPEGENDGQNGPGTPEDGGVTCDGTLLNNATQTDVLMGDIKFSALQARHNPSFLCGGPTGSPSPTPTSTPTPTPIACGQADVMLVLDRSGSISSTELGQLKTAAKAFIDALGLSVAGIHAGKSSFATTGSLNHHLSSNSASVKAAIDAMVSGGFTNLKAGIDIAKVEMDNPGDGHDRAEPGSPDKMIVITDGHPNRPLDGAPPPDVDAANAADAARAAGSEIFVVGVGSDVDATYLQNEIADNAAHYYSAGDYAGLQTALQNLDLCD